MDANFIYSSQATEDAFLQEAQPTRATSGIPRRLPLANLKSFSNRRDTVVAPFSVEELTQNLERHTSVLRGTISQAFRLPAALASPSVRPTLQIPLLAARSPAAPPTKLSTFAVSTIADEITEADFPDLINLETVPSWVPVGVSTLRYLRAVFFGACASQDDPYDTAVKAYLVLHQGWQDPQQLSLDRLPRSFGSSVMRFPVYSANDPLSFWNLMRSFLFMWLKRVEGLQSAGPSLGSAASTSQA